MKNENFKFKELKLKKNISMAVIEVQNAMSKAIDSGEVTNKKEAVKLFVKHLESFGYDFSKACYIDDDLKALHDAIARLRLSLINKDFLKKLKANDRIIMELCQLFVGYHVGFHNLDLSNEDQESKIKLDCYFDDRNCLFRGKDECFGFATYRDAMRFIQKYHPGRLTPEKEVLIHNWQEYAEVVYGDSCPSNIHILTL